MIRHLHHTTFRAMGTTCTVSLTMGTRDRRGAHQALVAARGEIGACDHVLSRFDPRSDLSRVNGAAGEWVEVDSRLEHALAAAVRIRAATGGWFDPTVLPALIAAGYDRSFEQLELRPAHRAPAGWQAGAAIEVATRCVRVERGAAIDLGGIGKGFSAGRTLAAMRAAWPELPGAIVDLGGDIAAWGVPPDGGPWRIAVADPSRQGATLGMLRLEHGAVATSGRNARRFGPSRSLHHLIDPATGAPAAAGPLAVTVVAPDAADAEGYATALAISGLQEARALLHSLPELGALFVDDTGRTSAIGALPLQPATAEAA
jgi:thiamine biosynthesis lipoprotein